MKKCDQCGNEVGGSWYALSCGNVDVFTMQHFCCRRCLVEAVAPELKQAVVINQWVPTAEDEARMNESI
jgi:hypothetical protein